MCVSQQCVFLRNVSTMQKAFILCLFFWNYSTSVSQNNQLDVLPGCRAVIPCQRQRSDSDTFKWFYKKNDHSHEIKIFEQNKHGMLIHSSSQPRKSLTSKHSLVISHFKEDDQGLYRCESCYQNKCSREQATVVSVMLSSFIPPEIQNVIQKTIYVTAGSTFTHECPGELTKSDWSFEASNATISSAKLKTLTSNKSIRIRNVTRADAGKYTCWTSRCDGYRQKLLTINLCIVTVHQREDSSISCAVICDEEFSDLKSNNMSNVDTSTWTTSLHLDVHGSLNCTGNGTQPSNRPTSPESKFLSPVVYGTSAAAACLILVIVSVLYFRTRLWAGFTECCSGSATDDRVEETHVIYSSLIIRKPVRTTSSHMADSDCVYSVPTHRD
ncbi:mediator of RNA polymerase II transcription subunit 18 isoform X1 [Solea senegalensis]|uniref:Mediator of RNA polymerase II transcription subunit 18 isoform X1 n=1 Tax=Solea senegalensis TaxID=28829 RepID=A0AAV6PQC2_SOLSE|nr:uncharacterized protein LOC122775130 isoform X2 [Solea senegalensis]KAG7474614.1 mediator of RNA polymerase II transcription subunit 18 isoform X1 [Solea senegalensis]